VKPPKGLPRRLSAEEAALWARVAKTVSPLDGGRERAAALSASFAPVADRAIPRSIRKPASAAPMPQPTPAPTGLNPAWQRDDHGLDGSWDRRLSRGIVQPDFTLDLHGCTLDQAHSRLDHGLAQALAHGARVVLLVTGRARQDESAGRGERRGAIRAKFRDWLEAGPHAGRIAAVRPAHPRHGGAGAVYVVLRRAR